MGRPKSFLAIDPGREKIGVAVLSWEGKVQWMGIVNVPDLEREVRTLQSQFDFTEAVLGDSTGKERIMEILQTLGLAVALVDERYSSEEARRLYCRERFSSVWWRILPLSLFSPRCPYDDWQAVVIGRRYLQCQRSEKRGT